MAKAQENNKIAKATIDLAAEMLPLKKPMSLKGTINGAFMACITKSKLLVPHVPALFAAIKKGEKDLLIALTQVYPHAPEAVEENLQVLIDIIEEVRALAVDAFLAQLIQRVSGRVAATLAVQCPFSARSHRKSQSC